MFLCENLDKKIKLNPIQLIYNTQFINNLLIIILINQFVFHIELLFTVNNS